MGKKAPPPPPPAAWWEAATAINDLSVGEATLLVLFVSLLFYVRVVGYGEMRKALAAKGARPLNISALARVAMFKEVFLAYLNAALLEPLLSIANTDYGDDTRNEVGISVVQLLGLVFWTYMITDAFDTSDTAASFVYRYKVAKEKAEAQEAAKAGAADPLPFLKITKRKIGEERSSLAGSCAAQGAPTTEPAPPRPLRRSVCHIARAPQTSYVSSTTSRTVQAHARRGALVLPARHLRRLRRRRHAARRVEHGAPGSGLAF